MKRDDSTKRSRQTYHRPRLHVYGSIARLTLQHASSAVSDQGANLMAPS